MKLMTLIASLPEDDLIPGTNCRKADFFKSNVEFEVYTEECLTGVVDPTFLRTGRPANDDESLRSGSIA